MLTKTPIMLKTECNHRLLLVLVSGECNLLGSISSQQKFEATDIKAPGASQLSESVIAPSVLFRK